MVDRAPVAGLLLEQQLLAALDEEVRDVEDADRELLLEERDQRPGARRVVGVLALQVLGQQLHETHLRGQEARRRELRDEAAAGMAAQEKIRLQVRAGRRCAGPSARARPPGPPSTRGPVVLGNAATPARCRTTQRSRSAGVAERDERRQGASQVGAVEAIVRQTGALRVGVMRVAGGSPGTDRGGRRSLARR